MTASSQLAQLRQSPIGRWLRPARSRRPGRGGPIDLGRVVRERAVVLFSLGSPGHASAAARLAWLIGQDILATDRDLQEIGIDGDGLAWFEHAEGLPQHTLRDLVSHGAEAGLPVMLTTTSARAAAGLAAQVNALVIHRIPDADSAAQFAAQTGERLVPGAWAAPGDPELTPVSQVPASALQALGRGRFTLVVRLHLGRLVTTARTVPAARPSGPPGDGRGRRVGGLPARWAGPGALRFRRRRDRGGADVTAAETPAGDPGPTAPALRADRVYPGLAVAPSTRTPARPRGGPPRRPASSSTRAGSRPSAASNGGSTGRWRSWAGRAWCWRPGWARWACWACSIRADRGRHAGGPGRRGAGRPRDPAQRAPHADPGGR